MLLPSIFYDDFFDVFDDDRAPKKIPSIKTDIKESENDYLLELELPGFSKDDVSLVLENGYLTISATQNKEKEQKEYKYVRKERKSTSMQRSFYVGDNLTETDIKAGFDNGILTVTVPKKVEEAVETKKYIPIA